MLCLLVVNALWAVPARASSHAHGSECQRLTGHDLAPDREVKLVRSGGGLSGCVLPRGRVRDVSSTNNDGYRGFPSPLRAVAGAIVLFDQHFNDQYVSGEFTIVFNLRTGRRYVIAQHLEGPEAGSDLHFTAPRAFIDRHGAAVAAVASTTPDQGVGIVRFTPAGVAQLLDLATAADIAPASLTRRGDVVAWTHAGERRRTTFAH
jgi:hypothetical protein